MYSLNYFNYKLINKSFTPSRIEGVPPLLFLLTTQQATELINSTEKSHGRNYSKITTTHPKCSFRYFRCSIFSVAYVGSELFVSINGINRIFSP